VIQRIAHLFRSGKTAVPSAPEYRPAPNNQLLIGQTALVSGAAGLIGSAIVAELLSQGADVTAIDCDGAGLAALENAAGSSRLAAQICDLTDANQIARLDARNCDLLIHAAGVQVETTALDDTDLQWSQSLDANVAGPVRLTRKMLPALIRNKGSIIMVSSIHAALPSRWANYSAAKAAQDATMREWSIDLAPHGVRVNSVAPGWVSAVVKPSKLALLRQQTIPPEYIARAVTVLASDYYSRFTTGSVVSVDAGASHYSGRVPFDLPTAKDG